MRAPSQSDLLCREASRSRLPFEDSPDPLDRTACPAPALTACSCPPVKHVHPTLDQRKRSQERRPPLQLHPPTAAVLPHCGSIPTAAAPPHYGCTSPQRHAVDGGSIEHTACALRRKYCSSRGETLHCGATWSDPCFEAPLDLVSIKVRHCCITARTEQQAASLSCRCVHMSTFCRPAPRPNGNRIAIVAV